MWLSHYRLTRLATAWAGKPPVPAQPRRRPPLCAEQLEDRTTPATLTPTTFADGVGIGSLRDAVLQADGNGQNNTIVLAAGTYSLSVAGRNESAAQTGDLNLTASGFTETINGAGASATIINASRIDRVFEVLNGVTVVLNNLTVTGGLAVDGGNVGGNDALGGGLLNNGGNLTLNQVIVTGNTAQASAAHNARGGGIYSAGGALTLTDSTITSNSALAGQGANGSNGQTGTNGGNGGDAQGGGLYVSGGTLTITGSALLNNQARGGNGGSGGNGNGTVHPTHGTGPFFTGGTGPFFTSGPSFPGGFTTGPAFPVGGGSTGGGTGGFTGGGTGGFTGGGTGGFSGGGGSGGSGGGSSLRAAPEAGHGGLGGLGGRGQGGGLYVASGTAHISKTKFSGNAVTGGNGGNAGNPAAKGGAAGASQGGGAFVGAGTVTLQNATLTGNAANQALSGRGRPGGGAAPLGQGPNLFVAGGTVSKSASTIGHKAKVGIVRPGPGGSANFTLDTGGSGIYSSSDPTYSFGLSTDQFFAGDWTGSGSSHIGIARPDGNGSLLIVLDTNGNGQFDASDQVFHFGLPGDRVIVGDWNGAGKSEIGVVRPDGQGSLLFVLDTNGDGVFDGGDQVFDFGETGDTPVIGDWNGAGKSEIGVARSDGNGSLVWALDANGDGVFDGGDTVYSYGAAGDHPIVGDWSASGHTEIGVYRPDPRQNTLLFTLDANGNGVFDGGDQIFTFGEPGDTVVIGKWKAPGQPLQVAATAPALAAPDPTLTAAELAPIVNEATALWTASGMDAQQVQELQQLNVRVAPLPDGRLGYRQGETLTLSPNAAGYGWFVDATPNSTPPPGRMDLLTAVLHEEGHALGLPDLNPSLYPNDVMTGTLSPGIQRLPRPGEASTASGAP